MSDLYKDALRLASQNGFYDMPQNLHRIHERTIIAEMLPHFKDNKKQLLTDKRRVKRQFTKMGMSKEDINKLIGGVCSVAKAVALPF